MEGATQPTAIGAVAATGRVVPVYPIENMQPGFERGPVTPGGPQQIWGQTAMRMRGVEFYVPSPPATEKFAVNWWLRQ
jgi:hypothetical protein